MESSKKAWDDVGESVGGLGKALSKRFKQEKDAAGATVGDEQVKAEAREAGRSFMGALSATANEVSDRVSAALDNDSPPPPGSPAPVDPTTLPPPGSPTPAPATVDPTTLPPPGGAASDPADEAATSAFDPTTLPPPAPEGDPST